MTNAKPPVVVVDTTEMRPDLILSRSAWLQTRLWALKGTAQLWVPEVVIRETVRHYAAQLDLHLAKLHLLGAPAAWWYSIAHAPSATTSSKRWPAVMSSAVSW